MTQAPARILTLAELVESRDRLVADLKALDELQDRVLAHARGYEIDVELHHKNLKDQIKAVDFGYWTWTLEKNGVTASMTDRAKRDYLSNLEKKTPRYDMAGLRALAENVERIYADGFDQTIREVHRQFFAAGYNGQDWRIKKKDNLQKIENQFRCRGPIYPDQFSGRWHLRDGGKFEDLMTACYLLEGKGRPDYATNFYRLAHDQIAKGPIVVTPYFTVQAFKNGNHKVTWNPAKQDVLDKLNRYGAGDGSVLGDSMRKRTKAEHFAKGNFDTSDAGAHFNPGPDLQFYPTPPELIARIIAWAEPGPDLTWLEPECGEGAIAFAMAEACPGRRGQAFEIDEARVASMGYRFGETFPFDFFCCDFLKEEPGRYIKFDRIVMNPPFHNQADAIHVLHAFRFLAPGGGLVAVMGAGIESSQTRTAKALREAVQARGGRFEENPPATFKAAGTMVRTVTLVIPPKTQETETEKET